MVESSCHSLSDLNMHFMGYLYYEYRTTGCEFLGSFLLKIILIMYHTRVHILREKDGGMKETQTLPPKTVYS